MKKPTRQLEKQTGLLEAQTGQLDVLTALLLSNNCRHLIGPVFLPFYRGFQLLVMIGFSLDDRAGPIELFQENGSYHLV